MYIIQLFLGVMLAWYAIKGKGRIYKNDYLKKGKEKSYYRVLRLCMAIIGPFLLIHGILIGYVLTQFQNTWLDWGLWGLGFAGIIFLVGYTYAMTDRKRQKADEMAGRGAGNAQYQRTMRAAFVFDDELTDDAPETETEEAAEEKEAEVTSNAKSVAELAAETAATVESDVVQTDVDDN